MRQVSRAELKQLQLHIAMIRCNGCGAPVDIRKESACGHCRAPVAILDADAVEKALAGYAGAAAGNIATQDPATLAETLLRKERERSRRQQGSSSGFDADIGDLLQDGVGMVMDILS